jgi:hypothetical protein
MGLAFRADRIKEACETVCSKAGTVEDHIIGLEILFRERGWEILGQPLNMH